MITMEPKLNIKKQILKNKYLLKGKKFEIHMHGIEFRMKNNNYNLLFKRFVLVHIWFHSHVIIKKKI
jgi:hypothetical protein